MEARLRAGGGGGGGASLSGTAVSRGRVCVLAATVVTETERGAARRGRRRLGLSLWCGRYETAVMRRPL